MDIHKPKPVHGWRDFVKEIGGIVLGVCIALAAEQSVEWWHWKNRVADARTAILLELRDDDAPQAFTRVAAADCFDRQLDALQTAIEAGKPRAEIAALVKAYKLPFRTWESMAWNTLLASGAAAHVAPEQLIQWSTPYDYLPLLAGFSAQETRDYIALRPIRLLGQEISPGEADAMLTSISRLHADNRSMSSFSAGFLADVKSDGIEVPQELQRVILAGLKVHLHGCVKTPSITRGNTADSDQTGFLK